MALPTVRVLRRGGVLVWSLALLSACAVPVAMPRTGEVLRPGELRLGSAALAGVAPTTATATSPTQDPHTVRGYSPTAVGWSSDLGNTIGAVFFGPEVQASYGLFEPCELGAFLSFARAGAEVRCGTSRSNRGPVQLAFSGAIATTTVLDVPGMWWRGGMDLSFGRGDIAPMLNLVVGYVPWRRGVTYFDKYRTEWTAWSAYRHDRGEYRLSVPVGVAVRGESRDGERTATVVVALVPEITFWSRSLEPPLPPEEPDVDIQQTFALFLVVSMSGSIPIMTPSN